MLEASRNVALALALVFASGAMGLRLQRWESHDYPNMRWMQRVSRVGVRVCLLIAVISAVVGGMAAALVWLT